MLVKPDGTDWRPTHQVRPLAQAIARARITPSISFHGLRHTWASLSAMNGMPLMVIARNLGHKDTRMVEHHYGHLSDNYIAAAIRSAAPQFEDAVTATVAPLKTKTRSD
jgi:integrase